MRRFYSSRYLPFLTDLLFDQLTCFDWDASNREIENEKKTLREKCCDKNKNNCNYLRVLDEDFKSDVKFCSSTFERVDDKYVYKTTVPKDLKPEDIKIDAYPGHFYFAYEHTTENGSYSASSIDTLPEDLDIDSMKAVLKGGVITITADILPEKEETKTNEDDETEYEIEIGK